MKNKVELVRGVAFELDPTKKYMICFERGSLSMEDVSKLNIFQNGSVAVMLNGDPNTAVKVIKETK